MTSAGHCDIEIAIAEREKEESTPDDIASATATTADCGRGCSCGCSDSGNSCSCDHCGPSCQCDSAAKEKNIPSPAPSSLQDEIKILVQPDGSEEAAVAPFDLAADKAQRKKASIWCYSVSISLLCLLLTMIAVWPPLRYFPPSSIQYPGTSNRVHYISAEYVQWRYADGDNKCYANAFGGPGPDNTPGSDLSTINGTFRKAIFRAYSDVFFNKPLATDPR